MTKYGYARVSSLEQNLERQVEQLKKEGCEKIFTDKISGASTDRPQLQEMLELLTEGDEIIIKDLTRFSRSTKDLFDLLDLIKEKKAVLRSLSDKWLDTSDDNPFNTLLFTIMSGLSEYERAMIKERQMEGIAIAKKKGVYKGRPKKFTENHPRLSHALDLYEQGEGSVRQVCEMTGITEATFYRAWKKRKEQADGAK